MTAHDMREAAISAERESLIRVCQKLMLTDGRDYSEGYCHALRHIIEYLEALERGTKRALPEPPAMDFDARAREITALLMRELSAAPSYWPLSANKVIAAALREAARSTGAATADGEALARDLCSADGRDPDSVWEFPRSETIRSDGDKAVTAVRPAYAPMWRRYLHTARALIAAGWRCTGADRK